MRRLSFSCIAYHCFSRFCFQETFHSRFTAAMTNKLKLWFRNIGTLCRTKCFFQLYFHYLFHILLLSSLKESQVYTFSPKYSWIRKQTNYRILRNKISKNLSQVQQENRSTNHNQDVVKKKNFLMLLAKKMTFY